MLNLADLQTSDAPAERREFTDAQKRAYVFLHLAGHPDWSPGDVVAFHREDPQAFHAVFDLFIVRQLPKDGPADG